MVSKQVKWAGEMFLKAFPHKSFPVNLPGGGHRNVLHGRGCHYWIVQQPLSERHIPGRNGLREYVNTRQEYKNLCGLLVRARIANLFDPDMYADKRNAPLIRGGAKRTFAIIDYYYNINSDSYFSARIDKAKDWDSFVESIRVDPIFRKARFHNSMYEVVVVTEKATVGAIIEDLCAQYGVHCLEVKGQASFTRVRDVVKIAQANKRPLLLLGLYDLDCAGWDMGPAFMKRVYDIYPHKDHKLVRVCLLRGQAKKLNLPVAFDTSAKDYPQKQKDRFERETGGSECIELDALDNSFIRSKLRDALYKYVSPQAEKYQNRRLTKRENKRVLKIVNEEFDYNVYQNDYEAALDKYEKFHARAERIIKILDDHFDKVYGGLWEIETNIKNGLKYEVDQK